jgi:hypothetical protein
MPKRDASKVLVAHPRYAMIPCMRNNTSKLRVRCSIDKAGETISKKPASGGE